MTATRRTALGALAATLATPALVRAAAIEQSTVEVIGVRDPQLGAQLAVADQFGLFKEQGLEVTIRWTQSAADTLTIMGGGSAAIGVGGSFTQVVFGGQKLPIRTITALADIAETQGFVLSPGVKLASPKELEGKRLAFTQGNSQVVLLAKLADMFGFDQSKITLVNMNQSEGVVAASKGDVHGLLGWQPNLFRLVAMGGTMYCTGGTLYTTGAPQVMPEDRKPLYNHSTLMATNEWIEGKPNTLAALLRALLKATSIINDDRARAMTALQRVLRVDAEALTVMVNANKYALGITPSLVASHKFQSEWAMNIKRIPAAPAPEDCFATRILELVDPALVTWKPAV
ncbi:ABC transporter substrate-binding protein [Belnapia rosea]|uniref:ABC-type nitrate/sulfonate/bicarbonate transport system, substrate-binding protein n=1 Tax=Belnapia rosea TaxID=938405 RepID=A0A1G6WF61_9PROT|nr:ABC transporter substrate-binding protein [Belnapia rosea]SDD64363.1 ABC-type nitrate/sulfonate/bicarbonate transport system, substrate-binding protein [Belnapia rosea]